MTSAMVSAIGGGAGKASPASTAILICLVGAVALSMPALGLPASYQSFLYLIAFWIALSTSWGIFSGNTGYFSFGHGAFYGVGAYTAADLVQTTPALLSVMVAGCATAAFAALFGAIVFRVRRLRGEVFALITLALTFVVGSVILNTPLDGGSGVFVSGARVPATLGSTSTTLYLAQVTIACIAVLAAWIVQRTRFGLALLAISDDEAVAELTGVPTYLYKIAALTLSALIAGLAGGVHALFVGYLTVTETFSITVPLYILLMGVLGGARHWLGPMVGAIVIASLNTSFVGGDSALAARAAIGLTLIVAVLLVPQGIMRRTERTKRNSTPRDEASPQAGQRVWPSVDRGPRIDFDRPQDVRQRIILACRGVKLSFRGIKALDGVDIEVEAGEILGLVGPNGSGKSTLINAISGLYKPQAGVITFKERDLVRRTGHVIARSGIARTFQIPRPFPRLTVLDNVRLAAMFGAARHVGWSSVAEAQRCLSFVELDGKASAFPPELNLHQRKFLEFARVLATGAEVVLLDEVLAGMTPAEIEGALALIRRVRASGKTIIFVEHNIRAVLELTDRLAVLDQGRIIALGSPRAVLSDAAVAAAYLGGNHA